MDPSSSLKNSYNPAGGQKTNKKTEKALLTFSWSMLPPRPQIHELHPVRFVRFRLLFYISAVFSVLVLLFLG